MRDSKHESVGFRTGPGGSKKEWETASHKQERALITRSQLIDSARTIFARDGFELARIEDIASSAGKSRGAFYANFKDKEDVFFAIFEEDLALDQQKIRSLLRGVTSAEQRVERCAEYLGDLTKDRQRTLLNMEFKVYAIRHPRRRRRLAELHALMRLRCSLPEILEFLPEWKRSVDEKRVGSLALGAIVDGFALNRLFDPDALAEARIAVYLRLCVRETLPFLEKRR